jgi:hypothetical protein
MCAYLAWIFCTQAEASSDEYGLVLKHSADFKGMAAHTNLMINMNTLQGGSGKRKHFKAVGMHKVSRLHVDYAVLLDQDWTLASREDISKVLH